MFHLRLPGCLPLGDHSLALTLPTALGRHTLNMGEVGLQLALRRQLCPEEEPIPQLPIVAPLLRLRAWPVARRIGGEGRGRRRVATRWWRRRRRHAQPRRGAHLRRGKTHGAMIIPVSIFLATDTESGSETREGDFSRRLSDGGGIGYTGHKKDRKYLRDVGGGGGGWW